MAEKIPGHVFSGKSERNVFRNIAIINMFSSLLPTGNLEFKVSWLFLVNRDVYNVND